MILNLVDVAADLMVSIAESMVREVCRDDRSEGRPLLPAFSGPSFEVPVARTGGLDAKSAAVAVLGVMM